MIELTFIRHGQTDWNLEKKIQGVVDTELNSTGITEANSLKSLVKPEYDYFIASPLKRAYKTATILNQKLGMNLESDKLLVERDFGLVAGSNIDFAKTMEKNLCDTIESLESVENRIKEFLDKIVERGNGRYLVVTHGGVISILLRYLSEGQIDWTNTPINNCSLTKLKYEKSWGICFINRVLTNTFV